VSWYLALGGFLLDVWRTKGFMYWFLQSNRQSTISPCSVALIRQHAVTYSVFNLAVSYSNCICLVGKWASVLLCETWSLFSFSGPKFLSYLFILSLFLSYIYGLFNDVASSSDASYGVDSVVTAVALASPLYEHGTIKKTAWKATLKYIYHNSIAQIIEISLTSVLLHDSIKTPRGIVG